VHIDPEANAHKQATAMSLTPITYELLSYAIERSNNIISLFKELENIRINS
jgi:DNA-binding response OmpR family regulator